MVVKKSLFEVVSWVFWLLVMRRMTNWLLQIIIRI